MTQTEALRLALEALKDRSSLMKWQKAITAVEAALEANEFNPDWDTQAVLVEEIQRMAKRIEELEAQRTWVGLTDEERNHARQSVTYSQLAMTASEWTEAVQIETEKRLKEKNK
jgi:hypothetical protein